MNISSPFTSAPWTDRTTSAMSLYTGGIGYANRVQGVDGWFDFLNPTLERAGQVAGQLLDGLLSRGAVKAKQEALGYVPTGQVWRDTRTQVDYVMFRTPAGAVVGVDANGNEVPASQIDQTKRIVDERGISMTTLTIGTLAVAAIVAAFVFTRKR